MLVGISVQRTIGNLVAQMISSSNFSVSPNAAQLHYRVHKVAVQSALAKEQQQQGNGSSSFGGHHLSDQAVIF